MLDLNKFKLTWDSRFSTFEAADRWLAQVLVAKPRVLDLHASGTVHFLQLSDDVFVCEPIEELNLSIYLSGGSYYLKPKSVDLKCLKKLQINGRIILDDEFLKQLMCGCPAIEELVLGCKYEGLSTISSNFMHFKCLKKLMLRGDINLDENLMRKLIQGSPILEELSLHCNCEGLFSISSQSLKCMELFCLEKDKFEISIPSLRDLHLGGYSW